LLRLWAGLAGLAAIFVCSAGAGPEQMNAPLYRSAAWQKGLAQLERYKQGGDLPPPLRIGLPPVPPASARVPSAAARLPSQPKGAPDWRTIIRNASRRHGVDEALLTAVMQVESNFNQYAVSPAGARGAMQIMPETGKALGLWNFFDPVANTDAGARYLAEMLRIFPRLELSLAAYNAGPEAVHRYGEQIPPFQETRDYVVRVLSLYRQLNDQRVK
jgi:soluble lytic murein transglycosylase-like protein